MGLEWMIAAVLLQSEAVEPETAPPLVTIEQLHRDPDSWDAQRIRVAGYFNECIGPNCRVCDEPETHSETDDDGDPASWSSPYCAGVESFSTGRNADHAVRNSLALIEATYSTRCVGDVDYDFEYATITRHTVALCTDRAGELTEPSLLQVWERDVGLPPLVTIEEIHQDPWAWDGRRVRAIVRANECFDLNCAICDEPGEGEPWPSPRSMHGGSHNCAGVSFVGGRAGDATARYNTILIEGEYSAFCSGTPQPGVDRFVVCGDRSTEFYDTAIVDILREHSALEMQLPDERPRLVEPTGDLLDQLRVAYSDVAVGGWYTRQPPDTFFWISEYHDPDERVEWHWEAGACECVAASCFAEHRPRTRDQLFDSVYDSYRCFSAVQREDGNWVFPLQ